MWNTIQQWLHGLPTHAEAIESVLMAVAVLIMRSVLLTTHFHHHSDLNIEDKHRSPVLSRSLMLMLILLSLAMVWAAQIRTLALSMFVVVAVIMAVTREPIMCLPGSIPRSAARQYSVGGYIKVNGLHERMVDTNFLNTLMIQIGPHPLVGQLSGRTPPFPNSLLLNHYVRHDNILGPYAIHTVEIPVPIHLDPDVVISNLKQVLEPLCVPYVPETLRHLDAVQAEKLFITSAAQPCVTRVPYNDKAYSIIVCYALSVSKRLEIQQVVLDEFLRVQYRLLNPHSQIHYIDDQESIMLPESVLAQIYPVIMTPNHDGKYFHNYVLSLFNITRISVQNGWPPQTMMQRGENLIICARDNYAATFMTHPERAYSFWIGSDIGFSTEASYHLLLADKDAVAGICPLKWENWPAEGAPAGTTQTDFGWMYTCYTINTDAKNENGGVVLRVDEEGLMKINDAPIGFMVIKRSVSEKMTVACPKLNYISDSDYNCGDSGLHYRSLDRTVDPENKRYFSEDYMFCRLWQQVGGEVYVGIQSNPTHQDAKIYRSAFADPLRTNVVQVVFTSVGMPMNLDLTAPPASNPRGAG